MSAETGTTTQQALVLPLWKSWVSAMREVKRIAYGQFFTTAEMELAMKCKEESLEFRFNLCRIRRLLRREGKNITARGQGKAGYVIAAPETNSTEMLRLQKAALTAMKEGVILGTTTPMSLLTPEDQQRHEAVLEKMAKRLSLVNRRALPESIKQKYIK